MKQLTQSEIRKNGKVYKNVSSPATEGTMKQVTDIVEKDGTFSISTDGGKTYSPAVGAVPEALPQEASALKSGSLPTSGWTTIGISTEAAYAYTISDTDITENSDILMELTDEGGVKSYSMEAGKMTVIRDTVPTSPIPYTYKVKQTNASGQFTLVNHFVPNIPVTSVNGQTGAVTIAVPTKTSELTNDSGFVTNSAIGKGTLTIQKNGANVATFGANQSENATANISVPTKTSDLTNDSGFVTSADVPSKTSDLTNDSGFLTKNNIVAGDNVTVTDENGNVKISATGGGSGGVTYTKLTGSVDFTTTAYTDDPYFLDQNAATWSENSAVGNKALTSTTDIGLFIGTSYTMVVNIQGTSSMFSAKAEDGSSYGLRGSKVLWFKRDDIPSQFFIYDHCTIVGDNIQAGNGCIFDADLGSDITIADINYFSGNRGVITPVTITNSAIKINSAVTMYINSSLVVSGTKTDGSITLTASTEGSVSYEMEILNTSTEGLFEVINAYVPDVPTKTSQLENDSGFVKPSEANTFTAEQTFSNANGIKTNRVHNLNDNAWYDFDGTNDRFGSLSTPTVIRTSEPRPKAEVPSGSATVTKEIALLEDVPSVGEWVDVAGETATLTQAGTYQVVLYGSDRNVQSIIYWDGSTAAQGIYSTVVDLLESRPVMVSRFPQITAEGVISFGWVTISQSVQGDWLESNTTVSGFKYRKIN